VQDAVLCLVIEMVADNNACWLARRYKSKQQSFLATPSCGGPSLSTPRHDERESLAKQSAARGGELWQASTRRSGGQTQITAPLPDNSAEHVTQAARQSHLNSVHEPEPVQVQGDR
jgi:hypothetical protein